MAPGEFRRGYYRCKFDALACPRCGQPFDWAVFRRRGGRPVFQGFHPAHAAAATIHHPNQRRPGSRAVAGTGPE